MIKSNIRSIRNKVQSKLFKSISHLRQYLSVPEINTNKAFSHNGQACGVIFSNNEQLTAMSREDNKIIFKSGEELTFYQYRGQVKHYNFQCSPNIYRTKESNIFLEICRTVSFENFLAKHPFIQFINSLEDNIYINKTALAQHYELKTPYLDLTSNFDVASFFATCELINGKYKPYKGKEIGIIYRLDETLNHAVQTQGYDSNFEYIGWQPLPRPEQQRGSTYKLKINENFANLKYVQSYLFTHSRSQAKNIWLKFGKGKTLFPKDSTKDVAEIFKNLTSFTRDEINEAKNRFFQWFEGRNSQDLEKIIQDIEILNSRDNLNWNDYVENGPDYWEKEYIKTISKISYRNCYYIN